LQKNSTVTTATIFLKNIINYRSKACKATHNFSLIYMNVL